METSLCIPRFYSKVIPIQHKVGKDSKELEQIIGKTALTELQESCQGVQRPSHGRGGHISVLYVSVTMKQDFRLNSREKQ